MLTKARFEDLNEIDELAVLVILDMAQSNIPQWTLEYPRKEHYEKDIIDESLYVYKEDNKILGVITIKPEDDPPYKTIHSWLKEKSIVLHRILVHPLYRKKGIAQKLLDYAKNLGKSENYESIKIDTHLENYKMSRFLEKNGFIKLEYLECIDRMAYELILED